MRADVRAGVVIVMRRPYLPAFVFATCGLPTAPAWPYTPLSWSRTVERWRVHEIVLSSHHAYANPFADVRITRIFSSAGQTVNVDGFYDSAGIRRIRLMPRQAGVEEIPVA